MDFLVQGLDKMTEENKSERMQDLEEIVKILLRVY